ncbi:unnamed protein product [Chrysoparadoxa australica]
MRLYKAMVLASGCGCSNAFTFTAAGLSKGARVKDCSRQRLNARSNRRKLGARQDSASNCSGDLQMLPDFEELGDFGGLDPAEPSLTEAEELEKQAELELEEAVYFEGFDDIVPKINEVTLVGRTGADPTIRRFDDGNCVANLSLAITREYHPLERKAKGIRYGEEETDWFQLEMWGRDAEYAEQYIKKGMRIGVQASILIDTWEDKDMMERHAPKLMVSSIEIVETRQEQAFRQDNEKGFSGGSWESSNKSRGDRKPRAKATAMAQKGDFSTSPMEAEGGTAAAAADWWTDDTAGASSAAPADGTLSSFFNDF